MVQPDVFVPASLALARNAESVARRVVKLVERFRLAALGASLRLGRWRGYQLLPFGMLAQRFGRIARAATVSSSIGPVFVSVEIF